MSSSPALPIDGWLADVERHVAAVAPDLIPMLADYGEEARFGAQIVGPEIAALPSGTPILEIGAGPLLLSGCLAVAGCPVVAVEPVGRGFDHLDRLRRIVGDLAATLGGAPVVRPIRAETLESEAEFGYAFSINVMEHVDDVAEVLRRTWRALRPGGAYRFVCPNYAFPYEPHFGIPTLGSKALTARAFAARIATSARVVDPAGTWASLNWISVPAVRRICRQELGVEPAFDRSVFRRFADRSVSDPAFQRRRGSATRAACAALDAIGASALLDYVPAAMQPAMSCRIVRPGRP